MTDARTVEVDVYGRKVRVAPLGFTRRAVELHRVFEGNAAGRALADVAELLRDALIDGMTAGGHDESEVESLLAAIPYADVMAGATPVVTLLLALLGRSEVATADGATPDG